jgi:RNA polymerase sigma-70 factor (ECF subfamily)
MMPESDSSLAGLVPAATWLDRLRQRDTEAWQHFLRLYGPLVYFWCRARWRLEPADAADILQEVAMRVLEAIAGFRGGNFVAWLQAITRSRVVQYFQKNPDRLGQAAGGSDAQRQLAEFPDPRTGRPESNQDTDSSAPVGESAIAGGAGGEHIGWENLGGVLRRAVDAVRARCTVRSWQAFWQVAVDDRKPADVAGDLGMSTNAVYIAVSRILHQLRAEAGAFEKGPES